MIVTLLDMQWLYQLSKEGVNLDESYPPFKTHQQIVIEDSESLWKGLNKKITWFLWYCIAATVLVTAGLVCNQIAISNM